MPVPTSFKSSRSVPLPETVTIVTSKFCGNRPTWLMLCTTPVAEPDETSVKSEVSAPLTGSEKATRNVTFVAAVGLDPLRVMASTVGRMLSKTMTSKLNESGLVLLAASVAVAVKMLVPTGSRVLR